MKQPTTVENVGTETPDYNSEKNLLLRKHEVYVLKNILKKYWLTALTLLMVIVAGTLTNSSGVFASSPQQLYD